MQVFTLSLEFVTNAGCQSSEKHVSNLPACTRKQEGWLSSQREDFSPFSLNSRDGISLRQINGGLMFQSHMRSEKVIVSDKEGSEGDSTVVGIKATGGCNVVFIGSVKAFNELFKRSECFWILCRDFEVQ